MSRRRFRYNPETKAMEEVSPDYAEVPRSTGDLAKFDYDNLRATDGTDISSRTKRREYMRAKGLTDPSDYAQSWAKAQQEREAFRRGEKTNPERREALGRIAYELEKGKRR